MMPNGRKARYTIPPFSPLALLSSRPCAVLVHTEHPCACTAVTDAVIKNKASKYFFIIAKLGVLCDVQVYAVTEVF